MSSAEVFVQEASAKYQTLRYTYVKMSTNLKSTDMLKEAKCEKGQLAQWLPIPYVPVVDVVTPKEDPAVLKVKLPDDSHISVPIFSHGNNKEYIAHIVVVLRIIEQKGLQKKCRVYAKAVVKRQAALKNLQEASEPQAMSVDVAACKVEIEQTSQMRQESQMTRQSPSRTSNCATCCPVMHSPNGIVSATRCTSLTRGLQ